MSSQSVLLTTDLPLPPFIRGKVRDTYELGRELLIIASDRISAFDVVLPCGIPDKGHVLNQLSAFWFEKTSHLVANHLLEIIADVRCLDTHLPLEARFDYPPYLAGRSMAVKKVERIPVECVVRGYLAGSGWADYQKDGAISGVPLPVGLMQSQKLPQPIFTPSTKGETEHDRPMSWEEVVAEIGLRLAEEMREKSLAIYSFAATYALTKGIIIADTKFEFGRDGNRLILIDELLTPDSSRFWDVATYRVGQPQDSYDKQPVRDWLEDTHWNKEPPAPMLPEEVIAATSRRYRHAYEVLTGERLG
jgi:phosphoribosylaminoimidazole-succinocarboxamide synthase